MADKTSKVKENVSGKYYVDENCIGCTACVGDAPDNFAMNASGTNAYVYEQPENDAQEEACKGAMGTCPVDAIGDDGE
ncbi:MAG: ferredoxin [Candidatus Aureabacteria bacterium]|nr:ferredoxin [Candidatus Auribacterota bacterium]